jgi:hypothetical protein
VSDVFGHTHVFICTYFVLSESRLVEGVYTGLVDICAS